MDRKLLVNAPIEKIESKPISSSRLRLESEKQYLRLWEHNGLQTIMYNANSQVPSVYVEHDGKGGKAIYHEFADGLSGIFPPECISIYPGSIGIRYQTNRPEKNLGSLGDLRKSGHSFLRHAR